MNKIQNIVLNIFENTKEKFVFRHIHLFILGEHGGDALRNTLATVIPGLILFYCGYLHEAILIGLGALFASLTDLPGNRKDKLRSGCWTIPLFGITAWLTATAIAFPIALIAWLIIAAFGFTMISIYGGRFAAMGLMGLILVTFTIGLWPTDPLSYGLYIMLGVVWYFVISVLQVLFFPYRSLRYAIADSFYRMAVMLKNKAQFYDERIPLENAYKQLGTLHLKVSEQQENVRNLLLREKRLVNSSSESATYWIRQIVGVTDLYELLVALDHDYDAIRKQLAPKGVLESIRALILLLSDELDLLSWKSAGSLQVTKRYTKDKEIERILRELSAKRDTLSGEEAQILAATIRNSHYIVKCIQRIRLVLEGKDSKQHVNGQYSYSRFVARAPRGVEALRNQFTFRTPVFPFALRLALLFGIGGSIGLFLPEYHYTYWILITLVVVARPGFANTNTRNAQRIIGTLLGALFGFVLLLTISSPGTLLLVAVCGLFGFFFFNRIDYMLSVLCLTPGIIVALHVYEGNMADILGSRIIFTLIGSLLALAGWFFIPVRQSKGLAKLATDVVDKGEEYLTVIFKKIGRQDVDTNDIRLARKMAHSTLAAFSSAMNQLRREPGAKRWNWKNLYAFHSLAYRVNSLMIGLSVAAAEAHHGEEAAALKPRASHIATLQKDLQKLAAQL
ncbi:FUSC family protein [Sphingobacterium sp. lm-10]|uniref:FUSC family protein n=1 Tax=Sphingobacterium sp. lm-10 TaxID=2944904 RepID=UPI0020200371|nr:FUSC family membrane protein [Sphingobacterium sp. lm-10]MCL7988519.1 FUSC family protein [Sphingobacterium sp. lm-10]